MLLVTADHIIATQLSNGGPRQPVPGFLFDDLKPAPCAVLREYSELRAHRGGGFIQLTPEALLDTGSITKLKLDADWNLPPRCTSGGQPGPL